MLQGGRAVGLLALTIAFSGCELPCWGGSPDPTATDELVAVEIRPNSDSLAAIVEDFRLEEGFEVWRYGTELRAHEAVALSEGPVILIGGKQFRNGSVHPLPDSLTACRPAGDSAGWVCAAAAPGVVRVSGDTLQVAAARTYLFLTASLGDPPTVLLQDSARFISEDRYVVTTYDRPVGAGDAIAFVRSRETRQVIRDSSGTVVNDIVYFAELDVIRLDVNHRGSMEVVNAGFLSQAGGRPWLALAPDGGRVAVEQDGVVWTSGGQIAGTYPRFAGQRLVVQGDQLDEGSQGLHLLDESARRLDRIVEGPVSFFSVDGNRIFYVLSGTLRRYDVSDGTDVRVFDFADYETYRTSSENIWISGQIHAAFPLADGRLLVFATTSWRLNYDDDC